MSEDDSPEIIQEPRLWSDGRWTARVIKNEDDDGCKHLGSLGT